MAPSVVSFTIPYHTYLHSWLIGLLFHHRTELAQLLPYAPTSQVSLLLLLLLHWQSLTLSRPPPPPPQPHQTTSTSKHGFQSQQTLPLPLLGQTPTVHRQSRQSRDEGAEQLLHAPQQEHEAQSGEDAGGQRDGGGARGERCYGGRRRDLSMHVKEGGARMDSRKRLRGGRVTEKWHLGMRG